jgi:uncharacterized protein (DUF305 family)
MESSPMNKHLLVIAATVMIGAAACGGDGKSMSGHNMGGSSTSPSTPATMVAPEHNDQDVMFAQMMIPHHQQAVEMSKLAATRTENTEVTSLAQQIERAQAPEIKTMTSWLKQWGVPMDQTGMEGMEGMDHGGGMPGIMSQQEMSKLKKAKGTEFDRMFLTMMTMHHQGAITMAKEEQTKGSYTDAKTMAGTIITAQQAEISKMKQLLK